MTTICMSNCIYLMFHYKSVAFCFELQIFNLISMFYFTLSNCKVESYIQDFKINVLMIVHLTFTRIIDIEVYLTFVRASPYTHSFDY